VVEPQKWCDFLHDGFIHSCTMTNDIKETLLLPRFIMLQPNRSELTDAKLIDKNSDGFYRTVCSFRLWDFGSARRSVRS
jgi:hypothetical protein